ncbi:hypothetical protein BcepF1.090 [Burkholderia phage BcepF1]|uniref:Uncharacterized protein n=1 Tax=Burkholderia phage BcepF1 TaxID=2886897 RepID=A1YZZ4_9CAUD|nr:hypothetical protein BcepF1.090 [Burkholderia phage BcepF1]ABL96821.1 hypothetical protein BcepF1.090 [Burkholderia phage BcepF1]
MTFEGGFKKYSGKEDERQTALEFVLKRFLLFVVRCAVYGWAAFYMAHPKTEFYPRPDRYSRFAHCWYIQFAPERARCWYEKKKQEDLVAYRIKRFQETGNNFYLEGIVK